MEDLNGPMSEPNGEEQIRAIGEAILKLRKAFLTAGLKPPVSIELGHHVDGTKLRCLLPPDLYLSQPQITDSPDPQWVCNIMGMEVRYPGQWRARERGGRDFV